MKFDAETYKIRAWSKQGPFYFQCVTKRRQPQSFIIYIFTEEGPAKKAGLHAASSSHVKKHSEYVEAYTKRAVVVKSVNLLVELMSERSQALKC